MPASLASKVSAALAQVLLERLDHWLAAQLKKQAPAAPGEAQGRLGLGIYYFEQTLEPQEASKEGVRR